MAIRRRPAAASLGARGPAHYDVELITSRRAAPAHGSETNPIDSEHNLTWFELPSSTPNVPHAHGTESSWEMHRESATGDWRLATRLYDERHILLARQLHLLALPQRVVYRERVDRHRQMLRMHLREAFAARVVSGNWQQKLDALSYHSHACTKKTTSSIIRSVDLLPHQKLDLTIGMC